MSDRIRPGRAVRLSLLSFILLWPIVAPGGTFDIRDFGAIGDGATASTAAIQAAIDEAAARGGGVVLVAQGTYLTSQVELKSHVTLRIAAGAELRGMGPDGDYPVRPLSDRKVSRVETTGPTAPPQATALVFANGQRNIEVSGEGIIDGSGASFARTGVRPSLIGFVRCDDVRVEGITARNSAAWSLHFAQCRRLDIRGIRVEAHLPDRNNDGIDLVECHGVTVRNSVIIADDDAIVFKSNLTADHGTRDILVENCTIYGRKSAVKIGTESFGPFEDIVVRNLTVFGTRGINLYSVDGANVRNVRCENIVMRSAYAAILIHVGNRRLFASGDTGRPPPVGEIRDVTIRNLDVQLEATSFRNILQAQGVPLRGEVHGDIIPIAENFVSGMRGHPVSNLVIENVIMRGLPGGREPDDLAAEVPENSDRYPLHGMFGRLPAWGLYVRHAENIVMRNVLLELQEPDGRPALVADEVSGLSVESVGTAGAEFRILERRLTTR